MKNIRGVSNQFYVGATNLLNLILLSFLYLSIFYSKTRWLLLFISVWSTRIFPQNLYTQNFKAWIPWLFNCLNTFPISPLHFIHCKFNLFNEHRNKTHLLSSDKTVLQLRSAMFFFLFCTPLRPLAYFSFKCGPHVSSIFLPFPQPVDSSSNY